LRAGEAVADLKGGRDEDNPLYVMAPKPGERLEWSAWVQVVVPGAEETCPVLVTCLTRDVPWNVDAVKEAAKGKFAAKLEGVDAADLVVCEGEEGEALRAGEAVADLKGGRDEDNPLYVMAPKPGERLEWSAWVQVVVPGAEETCPVLVTCPTRDVPWNVDAVRDAVKAKFADDLKGVSAAKLVVCEGEDGEALSEDVEVGTLQQGKTRGDPLYVMAPKPAVRSAWVRLEGLDKAQSVPAMVEATSERTAFNVNAVKVRAKAMFGDVLSGVGAPKLDVFDGDDGEPLRAGLLVAELKAGHDEQSPLVVKAPVFLNAVELTVWIGTAEDGCEATLEKFESEKAFQDFVAGRKLQHQKMQDGKVVKLGTMKSLGEAFKASQAEGTYLFQGNSLSEQVEDHEGFIKNHASGIELQTTRAIACDKSLQKLYGEMSVVNEGESVTFMLNGDKYLECDGLVKNTDTVLLNEAKATPTASHIDSLEKKVGKLQKVLQDPHLYSSEPEGAIKELKGLVCVVPLLSGYYYQHVVQQAAVKKQMIPVRVDGKGYITVSQ